MPPTPAPCPPASRTCRRGSRLCALAVAALVAGSTEAGALVRSATDTELARSSAAAVRGVVTSVEVASDPAVNVPYTHVTLAVTEAWGFPLPPASIVVKLLGGAAGGQGLVVGGQARFALGEDVVVFLDVRPRDGSLSVTGLELGKWTVTPATGARAPAAVRHLQTPSPGDRTRAELADIEALAALAGTRVRLPPRWTAAPLSRRPAAASGDPLPSEARWHEADWGAAVPVDSAPGGHVLFPGGGFTQVLRALGLWSGRAALRLEPGTLRTPRCLANAEPADGRISIAYDDPCGEIADTSPTLAIGGAYYDPLDRRVVQGVPYGRIRKGMIVLDNAASKFAGFSTGCYEEILAHELGHAIGLPHSTVQPSVMWPWLSADCVHRVESQPLQPADVAAAASRYPDSTPGDGPPATPGALTAIVDGDTVRLSWSPSFGPAPTAFQLMAGSIPGASDLTSVTVGAPGFRASGVARGTYYVRVVAVNAAGASAPTPDLPVVVGDGLPRAPVGVMAAAGPAGTVRVLWQPPPAGPAPHSYLLLAGTAPGHPTIRLPVASTLVASSGVAPGTYYVRIVGVNEAGVGPASTEIAVVVP